MIKVHAQLDQSNATAPSTVWFFELGVSTYRRHTRMHRHRIHRIVDMESCLCLTDSLIIHYFMYLCNFVLGIIRSLVPLK